MIETRIVPTGDTGLQLETAGGISMKSSMFLRDLKKLVDETAIDGVAETVCTYRTLMIHYRPEIIGYDALSAKIMELGAAIPETDASEGEREVLEIPVLYGGEMGPDLQVVAEHEGISTDEVIERHTKYLHYNYFIGFAPGHPYIGCEEPIFTVPRLTTPRVLVPKGSVAIWTDQTAVYTADIPGGWNILGRTPYEIFDKYREDPFLLKAGMWLRFRAIDQEEYDAIRKQVEEGTVEYKITKEAAK